MKNIKILGSGCPKCRTLYANVEAAVAELGLECSVEKVTDMKAIVQAGVMSTPALMVDGVLKSSGKVLGKDEISSLL